MAVEEKQIEDGLCQRWVILASLLSLLPLLTSTPLAAQNEVGNIGRLDLGFDKSSPGDVSFIPIIFSPAEEVEIEEIIAEITFPSALLSFEEARKGVPIDSIDAELSTEVRSDGQNPENSILEVVMTSKGGEAIPAGILVNLTFRISLEAPTRQIIVLEHRAEVLQYRRVFCRF